jgi:hypothetical protein
VRGHTGAGGRHSGSSSRYVTCIYTYNNRHNYSNIHNNRQIIIYTYHNNRHIKIYRLTILTTPIILILAITSAYTHIHIYTYTHIHTYTHTYTHTHTHTHTHIHTHTHTHTHTYTHTHTHTLLYTYLKEHDYAAMFFAASLKYPR